MYTVSPSPRAFLEKGRPLHDLSDWDRRVLQVRGLKIHLLAAFTSRAGTRCGRPLGAVIWTEDGVDTATCDRCKALYDTQED